MLRIENIEKEEIRMGVRYPIKLPHEDFCIRLPTFYQTISSLGIAGYTFHKLNLSSLKNLFFCSWILLVPSILISSSSTNSAVDLVLNTSITTP